MKPSGKKLKIPDLLYLLTSEIAALNKRINSRTDDAFLKELMRLGRMQKHLFVQGKRTGDKEYAEVLVAITELTNTLRKQLMEG
mgnify:CR=1 FL=1